MDKITEFLLVAPVILFSVVAHEYGHGVAAYTQGDRDVDLGFHPLPYIDPVGSIIVPIITFFLGTPIGWARSAPFDMRKFRNFKRGDIIVSLAGVTANLLVALLCAGLIVLSGVLARSAPAAAETLSILQAMFRFGIFFNLMLVALNLIPVPPLDGSRVFYYLLPPAWGAKYRDVGALGFVFVFLVLSVPAAQQLLFGPSMSMYRFTVGRLAPFLISGSFVE